MVVEGKRRMVSRYHEAGEVKKGPWKSEEDEVLINHVKKYGPRDWSSIRSKGLLQRTGKSCRLRWVNKLRPNLKSGVKFTAEEERIVIELQAQFGNKWAKIATYLSGRTDNDVKNFWSSRQKRLARIRQNSPPAVSNKPQKNSKEVRVSPVEAPELSPPLDSEAVKLHSCSSSHICDPQTLKMIPLPELVFPTMLACEPIPFQFNYISPEMKPVVEPKSHFSFPAFPPLQPDFPLPLESQDFTTRLGNPSVPDIFDYMSELPLGTAQLPLTPSYIGTDPRSSSQMAGFEDNHNPVAPDIFIDDFPPIHLFDQIEQLPSPSEWS